MNTLWLSVLVGVATGVAANLVTHVFVSVWLPAYRNYVYRGVRVSGSWTISQQATAADGQSLSSIWRLTATLKQHSYTLKGTAVSTRYDGDAAVDLINYDVTGYVRDRFVIVLLHGRDLGRISHSTFHLEVVGDGTSMRGYRTFYGGIMHRIRAVETTWQRRGSEAVDADDLLYG